jgi:methyltransferase (TIGR00027 family)
MKGTRPSRSAQAVTAQRAVLTDIGIVDDPFARGMLTPSIAVLARIAERAPRRVRGRWVTMAAFAARVRWFDAQVEGALEAGIDQAAVIGAGYDSRAWRLSRDGVRFFEVDHPATQRDKIRRAPENGSGPTFVPADLTERSAGAALAEHGLDGSRPALFVVEGVTMYLAEVAVRRLLEDLAGSTAPGGRLAANFAPPRGPASTENRRYRLIQRVARAGSGEPLRLRVYAPQATDLVESSGWQADQVTSYRNAAHDLVPPDSGLPVEAVSDHWTLLAATQA